MVDYFFKKIKLEKCIGVILLIPAMIHYLGNILSSFGITANAGMLSIFVIIAGTLIYIYTIKKKINIAQISAFLIFIILLKIAEFYTVGKEFLYGNGDIKGFLTSNAYTLFFLAIPLFFLAFSIDSEIDISNKILPWCDVVVCMQLFLFYISITKGVYSVERDYMSFAYYGMFATFVSYDKKNKNILQLLLCIISCMLIIVAGCRGALITIIIFIFMHKILKLDLSNRKNVFQAFVGAILLVVIVLNYRNIITYLSDLLEAIGFKSRTITKMLSYDEFFTSSGRSEIEENINNKIRIIGYGLYGDRTLVGAHSYAHNWMMEMLIDFGYFIGGGIVLYIVYLIINAFLYVRKSKDDSLVFLASSATAFLMGKYMFSASFLSSSEFMYSIMALIYIKKYKQRKIQRIV